MDAVIFDCDGTLFDVSSIRHHVRKPNRNFDAFHAESVNAPTNAVAVQIWNDVPDGVAKLVVTARKHKFRHHTVWALILNGLDDSDGLWMRGNNDDRKDVLVKTDMLAQIRSHGFNVVRAIDDNPSVIALWESEGIPTVTIPGWED